MPRGCAQIRELVDVMIEEVRGVTKNTGLRRLCMVNQAGFEGVSLTAQDLDRVAGNLSIRNLIDRFCTIWSRAYDIRNSYCTMTGEVDHCITSDSAVI